MRVGDAREAGYGSLPAELGEPSVVGESLRGRRTTCAQRAIALLCAAVMQFRQQQHPLIVVASDDRVVLPGA
jgi:hypothetical protein